MSLIGHFGESLASLGGAAMDVVHDVAEQVPEVAPRAVRAMIPAISGSRASGAETFISPNNANHIVAGPAGQAANAARAGAGASPTALQRVARYLPGANMALNFGLSAYHEYRASTAETAGERREHEMASALSQMEAIPGGIGGVVSAGRGAHDLTTTAINAATGEHNPVLHERLARIGMSEEDRGQRVEQRGMLETLARTAFKPHAMLYDTFAR